MGDKITAFKVTDLQNEFKKRLEQHSPPVDYAVPVLLNHIIECDDELLNFTLGEIGCRLRQFAKDVDFQHPEIVSIFDGIIANDQKFAQECMELIILGKYARENKLHNILPILGKVLTKGSLNNNVLRKIDAPKNNRMHVRLLKDVKDREEIRMTKRMQKIDLQNVYKKGQDVWDAQPDTFKRFLRFDTSYQEDLILAEKKAQRYEELGCMSLAREVRDSIESFKENVDHSYYGFNRITMTNAALILAKSLGYLYGVVDHRVDACGWSNQLPKITVNPKFFGKYIFDPQRFPQFSPAVSLVTKKSVFYQKLIDSYEYEPRVYPLHDFSDIMTDNVRDTISLLESFPDAENKPIFDHFGVIVPGLSLPSLDSNLYSFLDEKGIIRSYSIKEEAVKALDSILIKGEYFNPIIVGERDGKCYFICYWS